MMALRLLSVDINIARLRLCEDGNHPTLRTGGEVCLPARPISDSSGVLFLAAGRSSSILSRYDLHPAACQCPRPQASLSLIRGTAMR
jgi:hypothetical protein